MGGCHRNTLQYITVSPGQEGCTWLSPDHLASYPHTHIPWLSQPTWIPHRPEPPKADKCWDDGGKTHNWAVCPKRSGFTEVLQSSGSSFFKFKTLYLTCPRFFECFIVTLLFFISEFSHYKTQHTHALKSWKLIQTVENWDGKVRLLVRMSALWGKQGGMRER